MKNLSAFVRVARSGSFTAAASQLGLSTAAVSKIISRLEQQLQTRLFTRSTRRLSLTTDGRVLLEHAEVALAQMNEAIDLIEGAQREPSGLVRLWANAAIGKDHVLPLLSEFLARYPKLSVDVRLDDHVPNLIAAGYDLAVHHTALGSGTSIVKRLADLPLALVASADYVAKHGAPLSPEGLTGHECISTRSSELQASQWQFRRRGARGGRNAAVSIQPRGRVVISEQYDGVLNAALCGLGITLVFAHSVTRYLSSGELKVLLPDWQPFGNNIESSSAYLLHPQRKYVPYNVRTLIDFLTERFKDPARFAFDPYAWSGE